MPVSGSHVVGPAMITPAKTHAVLSKMQPQQTSEVGPRHAPLGHTVLRERQLLARLYKIT